MTARSRDLAVAFFAAALMTIGLSLALTAERASALLSQPPSDVTILHVEWDRTVTSEGVVSEGVKSVFPDVTFTETSQKASDFFKAASYGVFPGWSTNFGGTFKITAPRLPSGEGGQSQPCDTRFFEDITSRADAAAQAAGVTLGTAVIYYYDEKLCAQMPDAGAEAAIFNVAKKAVMQVTRATGPTRHELVHAIGHIMRLQHADSLNCTAEGVRVPFSDTCTVEPAGDPYDAMGEGTRTFSAGAIKALGWLKDEQHKEVVAPNDEIRRQFTLGAIADSGGALSSTRAIRFTDGGTNFWLELRSPTGIDVAEPPFPAQGAIGIVLHKEIRPPFGREPIFQLIDLSPSTPRSDPSLKLFNQSWTNPLGRLKVTLTSAVTAASTVVAIGPKPGASPAPGESPPPAETPPPPSGPTALVLQVGWQGQAGGTKAPEAFQAQARFTEASEQASKWFEEVSVNRKKWATTYAGNFTIPAPRTQFVGEGLANRCDAQTFADIDSSAEAALKAKGFDPSLYDNVVYAYNGSVCEQMPDPRGTAAPAAKRIVVQATSANFGGARVGSQTLIEAVGHQLGFSFHTQALNCVSSTGDRVPYSTNCFGERDPYDMMGGGSGSFNAGELDQLGYLSDGSDEVTRLPDSLGEELRTVRIAPLTAAPGRPATLHQRAIQLPRADGALWVEYRQPIGVDAPSRSGDASTALGLLVYRELRLGSGPGMQRVFQLVDMSPTTAAADSTLPVGGRFRDPVSGWIVSLVSADQSGAVVRVSDSAPGEGDSPFPIPLPHPVPPANPDPERSLLVLNVGWQGVNPGSTYPLIGELLDQNAYIVNGPLNEWYRHSAPSGRYPRDWEAYAGGSFMIQAPKRAPESSGVPLSPEAEDLTKCTSDQAPFVAHTIAARAESAAEDAGLDPDRFGHVMVVIPLGVCGFGGAQLPSTFPVHGEEGRSTIVSGANLSTIAHELGHALGLNHAQSLTCFNSAIKRVPLSDNCERDEYGDRADAMGQGRASYGAINANALGWMENQFSSQVAGDYEKTFTLVPWMNEEQPIEGFLRAVRLQDGPVKLWMEYRLPVGADAGLNPGLTPGLYIHREVTGSRDWPLSQLLDMTPETGFNDPGLPVGETWVNPLGTMQITLKGADASGAVVKISRKQSNVSVPDLRGKTTGEASNALEAVGLRYGGSTASVDDCTGTLYGRVISQNPLRNQMVAAGTEVTVTLGQKPKFQGFCQ